VTETHAFAPPLPQLALTFAARAGRTYLAAQRSTHPFHLGRVLYRPDDAPGLATVYMQGCAGGLYEHDRIEVTVHAEQDARAHLTTAAATIVHRMPHRGHASQQVTLRVESGALLEYCPDPLILFPHSRLRSQLRVMLAPGARAILSDAFLAHQLDEDATPFDWLDAETVIEDARGTLRARERYRAQGAALRSAIPGVGGRYRCQGSLWVLADGVDVAALRGVGAVTKLPSDAGALIRILAEDAVALRRALHAGWSAARAALGERTGRARPK
jgi:urease accessory protein